MRDTRRVVLASDNQAKLRELGELLSGLDMELLAQAALGISAAAETGTSFAENALIKARHASQRTRSTGRRGYVPPDMRAKRRRTGKIYGSC
jgi:inosine/xanthosine triphosphate pyrophosphatase family protein